MQTCKFFVIELPKTRFCPSTKEAVISFSPNPVSGDLKEPLHGYVCALSQAKTLILRQERD